ncbi:MAG TPA: carboxypeptidase-like regulatory domain-containing protein [Vicinamibacterales bacterium]|nr:carboxypeptidase-like regulatory domain-containing protein [Vicinamibacterales bacterium]
MAPLLRQGLVLLLLCVGAPAVLDGSVVTQRSTTGIVVEGTVIDASGATLPGVTVTLQRSGKNVAVTTTGQKGTFTLPNLRPGAYTLVLSLSSFKMNYQSVTLTAERPRLAMPPIRLEIGAITEP